MENPSYYSILTANVRYDKDLKMGEKVLYSEITALSNAKGYCTAGNVYFAKLYDKSKSTVSHWISHLADKGYIEVQLIKEDKTIKQRRIFPKADAIGIAKNDHTPYGKKQQDPIAKNNHTPMVKNCKENITSINNTSNNNISSSTTVSNITSKTKDPFEVTANSKEEEDKIINNLFRAFLDKTQAPIHSAQYNQIMNYLHKLSLTEATNVVTEVMDKVTRRSMPIRDPVAYLIRSLINATDSGGVLR